MQKILTFISLMLAFGLAATAPAQTMTVSGSSLQDASGNLCAYCTITFQPVDLSGHPLSFRLGASGGQVLSKTVSASVINGAFSITLPDTSQTDPVHACFSVKVTDLNTGDNVLGSGYSCVQPDSTLGGWCSSTACNFDAFIPNNAALPVETISGTPGGVTAATIAVGPVTTLAPGANATVTNAGTNTNAIFNFGIPQGATGATGPQGPKGDTGATGATGPQGPAGSGSGGTTISGVTFTAADTTIVAQWTTSSAADSFAYCDGQGAVDNGTQVGVTSHEVIIAGLIPKSTYECYVASGSTASSPQSVATLSPATRTPILSASLGSVTSTSYTGDTISNFLSSDGNTYAAMDDTTSPGPSANMAMFEITNESTLAMSSINALSSYGAEAITNGADGPGGAALDYKESSLFGMGGCLYLLSARNLYSTGGTVPQTAYFGNVTKDNCDHGATWDNHQAPAMFSATGSPDGPGVSMFTDTTNQAMCMFIRYAADDGTNGYLTAGNAIDGANAYVYANCTDGQWNNSSKLWLVRVPRANLATLTAGNKWQWWCGPSSPSPAEFVNPGNWSNSGGCKVSIYSAAQQVGISDEIFVPGFNYYVLNTWYQPTTGTASTTTWNLLAGPTPAGPWTSIYSNSFDPQGWYDPRFLHRPIATNTSAATVTADLLFSGNYQGDQTYYHPSYAPLTLSLNDSSPTQTKGMLPTPVASWGAQQTGIVDAPFTASGHLHSFTLQLYSGYSGPIDIGVCTNDGGGNFTLANYVTVTLAPTTAAQTFVEGTDFTTFSVAAGAYPCFYAPSGNGLGKNTSGGTLGFYYASSTQPTVPSGSQPYSYVAAGGGNMDLTETINIP